MTLENIKSDKVRNIISGSPTPASDINTARLEEEITQAEWGEADAYFATYSVGLYRVAEAELSMMKFFNI